MLSETKVDVRALLGQTMFDQVPFAVAIMDPESNIVGGWHTGAGFIGELPGMRQDAVQFVNVFRAHTRATGRRMRAIKA